MSSEQPSKDYQDGYKVGYREGESSADADLGFLLSSLDLPFDPSDMTNFDIIRKMAELLRD